MYVYVWFCDFIYVVWWSCHHLEQYGTNLLHCMPCVACARHVAWKGMSTDPLWTYGMCTVSCKDCYIYMYIVFFFFLSLSLSSHSKCFCVHFHVQASSSIRTCMVYKCTSHLYIQYFATIYGSDIQIIHIFCTYFVVQCTGSERKSDVTWYPIGSYHAAMWQSKSQC